VASVPPPVSFPMTPMYTNPLFGNSMESIFPLLPPFSLPMVTREYPYGMPTRIMAGLFTKASTYANNTTTSFSPYNTHYLASRSALSNPGRNVQSPTNFLLSVRQQMDESNHDMVNMLTQQSIDSEHKSKLPDVNHTNG
jgi:hypothetical protein